MSQTPLDTSVPISTPFGESKGSVSVVLAVDLGASSGRVVAGVYGGERLEIFEIHRFPTKNVRLGTSCFWDILFIYSEILQGLKTAVQIYGSSVVSIGVDSWGVDYSFLDGEGQMLGNPFQYRDARTDGMLEEAAKLISESEAFGETGIQPMFFNTVYQLLSEVLTGKSRLQAAEQLLFIPDLINYWLSGVAVNERTIASTSGMLNPTTGTWGNSLLDAYGIPAKVLGKIVEPGTPLGRLREEVYGDIGASQLLPIELVAVGSHDTASAVAGRAVGGEGYAFLSSGTWSLLGMELQDPVLSEDALRLGFSNEIGIGGSVRFLKNTCGLWLIQECRAQWLSEGMDVEFSEMAKWAEEAEPFFAVINPDDPIFSKAGDMPEKIRSYCLDTGQNVPESRGQILRVVTESLAANYKLVWDSLQSFAKSPLIGLNVVGGGSQNDLLNQCTANALGVPVVTGPIEATAIGNLVTQLVAMGKIASYDAGRDVVKRSAETHAYEPQNMSQWSEYVERLNQLLK